MLHRNHVFIAIQIPFRKSESRIACTWTEAVSGQRVASELVEVVIVDHPAVQRETRHPDH
jgi:hypothetical protein